MSHFTVLVVGDDIEEQLAPFQENNMEDCPKEYLAFHDVEDEYRKEYETDGNDMIMCPDKGAVYPWRCDKKILKEIEEKGSSSEGHVKIYISHKERYETFEEFMEDYAEYEKNEKTGRYGYWENPNAKWDWYEIGGRWAGQLQLTKEAQQRAMDGEDDGYAPPNFSWGWDDKEKAAVMSEARVDSAIKHDVDIEAMERPMRERAEKTWDEWHTEIKDLEEGDKKKREWIMENLSFFASKQEIERIDTMSREEYAACQSIWKTYAVVWDKKWYAKGEMGWFGVSTGEENNWNGQFKELWNEIPDDARVTVVDCHI